LKRGPRRRLHRHAVLETDRAGIIAGTQHHRLTRNRRSQSRLNCSVGPPGIFRDRGGVVPLVRVHKQPVAPEKHNGVRSEIGQPAAIAADHSLEDGIGDVRRPNHGLIGACDNGVGSDGNGMACMRRLRRFARLVPHKCRIGIPGRSFCIGHTSHDIARIPGQIPDHHGAGSPVKASGVLTDQGRMSGAAGKIGRPLPHRHGVLAVGGVAPGIGANQRGAFRERSIPARGVSQQRSER